MTYSVDVYYNANETVLELVKKHVEEKHNVETTTYEGFLFLKSDDGELFDTVVKELEGGEHPYNDYSDYVTVAECAANVVNGVMSESDFFEIEAQAMISDSEFEQQSKISESEQQEIPKLSEAEAYDFIASKLQELRDLGASEDDIKQMFSNIERKLS